MARTASAFARARPVARARTRGANPPRIVAPLLLLVAVVATTGTYLADRGFAVVHQCVPVPGGWGMAGMRLALVHAAPDCPSEMALGGDPAAMATVLGALAVPVLVAHALVALVAWGVTASVRRAHERARRVVARAVHGVRGARDLARRLVTAVVPGTLGVRQAVRPVPDVVPATLHRLADAAVRSLRGPPVPALA